jgi:hypothetical protein
MDQGPLVTEQIDAGRKLAQAFHKYAPLKAVFWLKEGEDGEWFLYLASDQINGSNTGEAYGEVLRIVPPGSNPWFDPFQVKVRGTDNPFVKGVIDLQTEYAQLLPMRLRNRLLGGVSIGDGYIYAIPVGPSRRRVKQK